MARYRDYLPEWHFQAHFYHQRYQAHLSPQHKETRKESPLVQGGNSWPWE